MNGVIKDDEEQIYGFKNYRWWGYEIIMEEDDDTGSSQGPSKGSNKRLLRDLGKSSG